MSLIIVISVGVVGALLIIGSICVALAALFPPKEWKGGRIDKMSPADQRKHQEEMYKLHQMG